MAPVLVGEFNAKGIVLVEEVVFPFVEHKPVRIVQPAPTGSEMEARTPGFTIVRMD